MAVGCSFGFLGFLGGCGGDRGFLNIGIRCCFLCICLILGITCELRQKKFFFQFAWILIRSVYLARQSGSEQLRAALISPENTCSRSRVENLGFDRNLDKAAGNLEFCVQRQCQIGVIFNAMHF